jgi:light-regulated signal transduction histidine kinase (bacteriophytochrome)
VGTSTDIHDQILLTEELERKVNERTHLLQVSNNELEQFAHISSHDLQEPLRKIRTFADLLKENGDQNLNDTSKRYIDKICTTAERMSDSLKALLNFTRLHREEKFVQVNLNEIVAHILIDLELMITQKNAVVQIGDLPVLKAIPIQMQQLFYNLINNALKFSTKDRAPEIVITSKQMGDEQIKSLPQLIFYKQYFEIIVKDNGIGFDQIHSDKIFTIFQRLHTRAEYEGTGIGLSLVKKVVNNHKGEIHAVSQLGVGTSFHIILPIS